MQEHASGLWRFTFHPIVSKNNADALNLSGKKMTTSKAQKPNPSEAVRNAY